MKFGIYLAGVSTLMLVPAVAAAQTATPSVATPDASPAMPQSSSGPTTGAAADTTDDNGGQIADIVVTATKRETNLQRTPIVIDVIGGDALAKVGVTNIAAIANAAPALNFGQANGVFTTVTIRGVSSLDATELGDPAIAFNVDGEYINRPLNLAASLFDVERVEVLRGPQGTLYGRNSTAGAVNIITARPQFDRVAASLSGSIGNYNQVGVQGYVNLPITSNLAVRVAGIFDKHSGYEKALVGPDLDDSNIKAGRIRVRYEPTNNLYLMVTGEIIKTTGNGPGTTATLIPTLPAGTIPSSVDVKPFSRFTVNGGNVQAYQRTLQKDVRAEVGFDFGFAKLTDVAGYRTTKLDFFTNMHGLPYFTTDYESHTTYRTFGNEIRLSSGANMPFQWQVGYYYFNEDQGPARINVFQAASPLLTRAYETPRLYFSFPLINATSNAFFGEATVPLGAGFSVTGGVRRTSDSKFRNGTQYVLDVAAYNASNRAVIRYNPVSNDGRVSSTRVTYNAVLNWQATTNNLFYVKYSTGYKAGGFTTINSYGPEDLTAYEAGTKNRFAGNKIQLNAAVYRYDYKNQQVQTFLVVNGLQSASTQNAASSKIWGAEAEFVAAITPDDRFRATIDYLHARYSSFSAAITAVGGASVTADLTGKVAPFAPDVTIGVSYSHTFHIGPDKLRAEVVTAFKSDYYLQAQNYRSQRQPAYTSTDLNLTYALAGDRFEIAAFVRNVENYRPYRFADFTSAVGSNFFRWQFAAPRTIGLRATASY